MKKVRIGAKHHNQWALVDDKDFNLVNKYSWQNNGKGYALHRNRKENTSFFMHGLIMGTPKGLVTDHINGDKLDNRRENLRIANNRQNSINTPKLKSNTSGYKGVVWHKVHKLWMSYTKYNNKSIFIGYFDNKIHAAMAYDIWAKEVHGEFAWLNFKDCKVEKVKQQLF